MSDPGTDFIAEIPCDEWDVPGLRQAGCLFDPAAYRDGLFTGLNIVFPAALERAVVKRKAEFLAGRFCARRAQAMLGIPAVQIGIGPQREPLWPPGVKASISHSRQMAMCVASRDAAVLGIGVDIEECMDQETAAQVQGDILTGRERGLLSMPGLRWEQIVTLIFSAKESFYKAAFPLVNRFFDFDAVSLVELDASRGMFRFRLNHSLHPLLHEGAEWEGRFRFPEHEKLQRLLLATLVVLGREYR